MGEGVVVEIDQALVLDVLLLLGARVYIFYKFTSLVLFKLFNILAAFEYNLIDVIVNHEKIF